MKRLTENVCDFENVLENFKMLGKNFSKNLLEIKKKI